MSVRDYERERDDFVNDPLRGHDLYCGALDEIDHLRAELTVANNRLGNAVGALIDAGTYCTGVDDVTAGIDRLRAEREAWEAFRQTVNCPSCDGDGCFHEEQVMPGGDVGEVIVGICPDCTDGGISMARLLAVGAAVFADELTIHPRGSGQRYVILAVLEALRRVRP